MNSYGLTTPDAAVYLGVDKVLSLKPHQFRDLKNKLANEKSSYEQSLMDVNQAKAALADCRSKTIDRIKQFALPQLYNILQFIATEHGKIIGPVDVFINELTSMQKTLQDEVDDVEAWFSRLRSYHSELSQIANVLPELKSLVPSSWDQYPPVFVRSYLVPVGEITPGESARVGVLAQRWEEVASLWARACDSIATAKRTCEAGVNAHLRNEEKLCVVFRSSELTALRAANGTGRGFARALIFHVGGGLENLRTVNERAVLQELFAASVSEQQEVFARWLAVADPLLLVYVLSLVGAGKGVVDADLFAGIYDYVKSPFTSEEMYRFNGLMGVDKGVQDVFARLFVEYAHKHKAEAFEIVSGREGPFHRAGAKGKYIAYDPDFHEFSRTVEHIRNEALPEAADMADQLEVDGVQLFGIGMHNNALTANIALGNVDTATNVTVNFLGMNSRASAIGDALSSSYDNLRQAIDLSRGLHLGNSFAVVVSISHKSAGLHNVGGSGNASAAVDPVTDLLDGINYARGVEKGGSPADQGFRLDTRWHSHVSRVFSVVAYEEKEGRDALETTVSSASFYGSPGVIDGLAAKDFPAEKIYTTRASADLVAIFGYSHTEIVEKLKPLEKHNFEMAKDISGIRVYSSDSGDGYKAVTSHDRHIDQEERPGEYGYDNYGTSSNYATALIMNGLEPELLNKAGE